MLFRSRLMANGITLNAGDALLMEHENQLALAQGQNAEVLVFDLCV